MSTFTLKESLTKLAQTRKQISDYEYRLDLMCQELSQLALYKAINELEETISGTKKVAGELEQRSSGRCV